jgi:Zn-dependent protease with chaperone function
MGRGVTLGLGWAALVLSALMPAAGAVEVPPGVTVPADTPSREAIAALLEQEPPSLETWPVWRERYLRWFFDSSDATEEMDDRLAAFVAGRLTPDGTAVDRPLDEDAAAWMLFRRHLVHSSSDDRADVTRLSETAARRAVELAPESAATWCTLAWALTLGGFSRDRGDAPAGSMQRWNDAEAALARTLELHPDYPSAAIEGTIALQRGDYAKARVRLAQGVQDRPRSESVTLLYLQALVADSSFQGQHAPLSTPLVERFPGSGPLRSLHALALAADGRFRDAVAEILRARDHGFDPATILGDDMVEAILRRARGSLPERLLRGAVLFVAGYALLIVAMATGGVLLSALTPRVPEAGVVDAAGPGTAMMSGKESWLARISMLALVCGIVLFYVAVPFLAVGLFAATGAALFVVLQLPRIPVKLLILVVIVGLGMAWAVLRSVFASHGRSPFGLRKTDADCPRLFAALRDVASRTESRPIDEVFLGPGSEIGVHQDGRGPFGMFGVKRRVLSLGLGAMPSLSVDELKSILAHEYAHFSHSDTFYSRFIQQVSLSIATALGGMAAAGGALNYVNPFYWFFWLYYHAYSLLSRSFWRSREYLADRMAVGLYGRSTFRSALEKVVVDGTLFESTAFPLVSLTLAGGNALENMYDAFRRLDGELVTAEDRDRLRQSLLKKKSAWFATHPSIAERFRAVETFPDLPPREPQPALDLFDDVPALERELTDYVTRRAVRAAQG